MNKRILKRASVSLFIVCIFVVGVLLGRSSLSDVVPARPNGYVDVEEGLRAAGYTYRTQKFYEKKHHGLTEKIIIDYNNNTVLRNDFAIDIKDTYVCARTCLMQIDKLEEIILQEPYRFNLFGTRYAPLIAHAGGGYRTKETSSTYTNTYEAIQQNYELGHRFFELDFQFTSDKKLAAVHNWKNPDSILNEHDWLIQKMKPGSLQHLTFTQVLDMMLVQRDMFLITDSKAFEIEPQEQAAQFNLMYDEIMQRDAELLERVIPQIYSKEMIVSHAVLDNFPNVIFTGYGVATSTADILQTLDEHPNIQMFTTDILGHYIDDRNLVEGIKNRGKKLSIHTVNAYEVFTEERYAGVGGYYTDFLTPSDWEIWHQSPPTKD